MQPTLMPGGIIESGGILPFAGGSLHSEADTGRKEADQFAHRSRPSVLVIVAVGRQTLVSVKSLETEISE